MNRFERNDELYYLSLDDYIALNNEKLKERKQNLHCKSSETGNFKRYYNDDEEEEVGEVEEEKVEKDDVLDVLDVKEANRDLQLSDEEEEVVEEKYFDLREKIQKKNDLKIIKTNENFKQEQQQQYRRPIRKRLNTNQRRIKYYNRMKQNERKQNQQRRNNQKFFENFQNIQRSPRPRSPCKEQVKQEAPKNMLITLKDAGRDRKVLNSSTLHFSAQNGFTIPSPLNTLSYNGKLEQCLAANNSSTNPAGPGKDIQSLLGLNSSLVRQNDLSMLAAKFLDFLQGETSTTVHKPIYDMKIQKEINELQGKSLIYKSGTEVVSMDGPGINNVKIKPTTSGLSLNCRFS